MPEGSEKGPGPSRPGLRRAGWQRLTQLFQRPPVESYLRPVADSENWGSTWATIFSLDPVIIGTWPSLGFPLGIASVLGSWLPDMPIEFLVMPAWAWEKPEIADPILTHAAAHRRLHPRHRFHFLCNTPAQERAFARAGWPVMTMNSNMFRDERTFSPLPDTQADFDAVYNARLTPEKRIELAAGIERLCLIYFYAPEETVQQFHAEHARLSALLPNATFLNRLTDTGCEFLRPETINLALNRSRVGLCLSAAEGQMRASMEYMMAGLPIVSTPSIGGRDYFFDPDYCAIVQPDPRAIAEAVAGLIARNIPRDYIRRKTLARVERERERFTAFVQSRIDRARGRTDFAERFAALRQDRQIKPWLKDVRAFAEGLDKAVVESERQRRAR